MYPSFEHNTLSIEQAITDIVRSGDTAALKSWASTAPAVRSGIIAPDQLRQYKNTFIVTATLVSRAAIKGGMAAEDAFTLSDLFIQKCELLSDPSRVINLQFNMVADYTEQVARIRSKKYPTKLTADVSNYVRHHLFEPITAENIAKELFISRPYLSTRFKNDTGITLTDFILKEKTDEAKRLLHYTDKSIATIGVYLGFSSQSHFFRVFKKYSGISPKEYRKKSTQ
jgi:AraC-like DNA-binding protein